MTPKQGCCTDLHSILSEADNQVHSKASLPSLLDKLRSQGSSLHTTLPTAVTLNVHPLVASSVAIKLHIITST